MSSDSNQSKPDDPASEQPTISPNPHDDNTLPPSKSQQETHPAQSFESSSSVRAFGDYELLQEIARGGMGVVYKARQVKLNRIVALKMILSGKFASDHDVRRFHQEAESAANLDHSGIVPIYEVGEHEGHHFFSMKLIEGGSLADAKEELKNNPRKSVELIAKIARAVHHAHQRGILHRDLKPANILLDTDGNPLVSDLGLAKDVSSDSDLTHTGAIVGTPAYMPPEQAVGQKEITTAADIYSIGAMFYELLAGRTPHTGATPFEIVIDVMEKDITPPRKLDSKINRTLELICMKCLQRQPDARYSSAAALADDLENWLEGKPVSARAPSVSSAITNFLGQNLRSAIGAMILGLVVGVIFATELSQKDVLRTANEHSVAVYDKLPNEKQPDSWWVDFHLGGIWIFLSIPSLGLLNVLMVKPKAGTQALAIGLVSGLMMMIAIYTIAIGPMSVSYLSLKPAYPDTELLSEIALGSVEQGDAAKRILYNKYADLSSLAEGQQSLVVSQKLRADSFLMTPGAILAGVLMTTFIGLLPSVGGTMLAAHMLEKKRRVWRILFPYFEVAAPVMILSLLVAAFYGWRMMSPSDVAWLPLIFPAVLSVATATTAVAVIRSWPILVRLLIHPLWVGAATLAIVGFAHSNFPDIPFQTCSELAARGEYEQLAQRLEDRTERDSTFVHNRFYAGVVQAWLEHDEGYLRHCSAAIESYDRNPPRQALEDAARLFLLRTDSGATDAGIRIAKKAVEFDHQGWIPTDAHWRYIAAALAAVRERKQSDFEEWAAKSKSSVTIESDERPYVESTLEVLRVMTLSDGDHENAVSLIQSARQRIDKARQDIDKSDGLWCPHLIFEVLLREAKRDLESP